MSDIPPDFESTRRKPPGEEPFFGRLYIRALSRPLTKMLLKTDITPNQITVLFLGMMIVGALLQVEQSWRFFSVLGVVLLQIGITLDACDGEIARTKKLFSVKGVYLDMVGHRLVHALLFCAIAVGLYRRDGSIYPFFLGMAACYAELAFTLVLYAKWRALLDYPDLLRREIDRIQAIPKVQRKRFKSGYSKSARVGNPIRALYNLWFQHDYVNSLLFTAFWLGVFNRMEWMLWLYGVVQPIRLIVLILDRVREPFEPDLPGGGRNPAPSEE